MKQIKPTDTGLVITGLKVFLAGSIEMGVAENWQTKVVEHFNRPEWNLNLTFFNPRRDSWDSSWKQVQANTEFNHQVNWELNKLDDSDIIFMYLDPSTKSPISLMEFGMYSEKGKLIVCCPDGFWRKGNIEIVCTRNNIPLFSNLEDSLGALETKLRSKLTRTV
jgi:hypothetical protein